MRNSFLFVWWYGTSYGEPLIRNARSCCQPRSRLWKWKKHARDWIETIRSCRALKLNNLVVSSPHKYELSANLFASNRRRNSWNSFHQSPRRQPRRFSKCRWSFSAFVCRDYFASDWTYDHLIGGMGDVPNPILMRKTTLGGHRQIFKNTFRTWKKPTEEHVICFAMWPNKACITHTHCRPLQIESTSFQFTSRAFR